MIEITVVIFIVVYLGMKANSRIRVGKWIDRAASMR